MADIDEEFEGEGEAVLHEAGGDEDAFRGAEADVAVADGAVAEVDVVGGGDGGLIVFADGQRHEVPGAAGEGVGYGGGHGLHDALEVPGPIRVSPKPGIEDAVGGLLDVRLLRHLGGGEQRYLAGDTDHKLVF